MVCSNGQCVLNTTIEGNETEADDFLGGGNLSKSMKYLIVLGIIMLIIGGFTALGFSMNMVQQSFTVGVVISAFVMIIFAVFGWIPAWILILLMLIAVASIILVSKLPSNNSAG
jgi:hypothetical protein